MGMGFFFLQSRLCFSPFDSFPISYFPDSLIIVRMSAGRDFFQEFDRNGFIVVEDLINRQLVDDLYVQVVDAIQKLFLHIENHQLSFGIGVKNGFKEVVQRQALRYEVKLTELIPLLSSSTSGSELRNLLSQIEQNSDLTNIVQQLFSSPEDPDYQIIHQSCVISYPGTEEQSWHSDGPHVSVTEYLPCHVFNVFIPLIDLSEELGPTEIRPESHHYTNNLTKGMLLAKLKKQIKTPVKPIVKKGSILIVRTTSSLSLTYLLNVFIYSLIIVYFIKDARISRMKFVQF